MYEPVSIGAIFASIDSAFKFADLVVRLGEVEAENEVFVRIIQVVRDDLNEVERLLGVECVQRKLTSIPGKLPWVKNAIIHTKSALNEIGRWVERALVRQESTGLLQLDARIRWVFNDHEKLLNRKTELTTCHQQLSNVLNYVARLEEIPTNAGPPEYIDATFFDNVLLRHNRKSTSREPDAGRMQNCKIMHRAANVPDPRDASQGPGIFSEQLKSTFSTLLHEGHVATYSQKVNTSELSSVPLSQKVLPRSPPPYTSEFGSNVAVKPSHTDLKTAFMLQETVPKVNRCPHAEALCMELPADDIQSNATWAYRPHQEKSFIPELTGDSVCFSATNSYGPVDPFDFSTRNSSSIGITTLKHRHTEPVRELLGDLSFVVEMPSNHLGPASGYPPRENKILQHGVNRNVLAKKVHDPQQSMSVPELSALSEYRPVPTHESTERTIMQRGFLSRSPTSKVDVISPERTSVLSTMEHGVKIFELPSSSSQPFAAHDSQSHTFHQGGTSPLIPASRTNITLPARLFSSPETSFSHSEALSHSATVSVRSQPRTVQFAPSEPAPSTRMHRQKHLMDLLGSI